MRSGTRIEFTRNIEYRFLRFPSPKTVSASNRERPLRLIYDNRSITIRSRLIKKCIGERERERESFLSSHLPAHPRHRSQPIIDRTNGFVSWRPIIGSRSSKVERVRDARFDAVLVNEATLPLSLCLIFNSCHDRCRGRLGSNRFDRNDSYSSSTSRCPRCHRSPR